MVPQWPSSPVLWWEAQNAGQYGIVCQVLGVTIRSLSPKPLLAHSSLSSVLPRPHGSALQPVNPQSQAQDRGLTLTEQPPQPHLGSRTVRAWQILNVSVVQSHVAFLGHIRWQKNLPSLAAGRWVCWMISLLCYQIMAFSDDSIFSRVLLQGTMLQDSCEST